MLVCVYIIISTIDIEPIPISSIIELDYAIIEYWLLTCHFSLEYRKKSQFPVARRFIRDQRGRISTQLRRKVPVEQQTGAFAKKGLLNASRWPIWMWSRLNMQRSPKMRVRGCGVGTCPRRHSCNGGGISDRTECKIATRSRSL
jgi:hypothetical protein